MKRRDFVKTILAGTTMTAGSAFLQACGGGGGDSSSGAGTAGSQTSGTSLMQVCTNTPDSAFAVENHALSVTRADVENGVEKTYDIQGGGGHNHTITVTAADFDTLGSGGSVTVESSFALGHTHTVTIQCV